MEYGLLRIFTYKGKSSKKYYKIARYNNKYYFVHISVEKIGECTEKKRRDNKKYLEYNGYFVINKDKGEIHII